MNRPPVQKVSSTSRSPLQRRIALMGHRVSRLHPSIKGMLWAMTSGVLFVLLNTQLRVLTLQLHPLQVQFLRYLLAIVVMLPLVARAGVAAYIPKLVGSQFTRGAVHALGLMLWFAALAKIPMAQTTAMSFTQPMFVMLGAYLFFREAMRWERWAAASISFAGVLIIAGPSLAGNGGVYTLLMLASSPVFAVSYLMTKALTRHERTEVIVLWQAISVSVFSLPLAWWFWQAPSVLQWLQFLGAGVLGVLGHYCLTRAFSATDISASQSVKFLDLVWASAMGWLAFGEIPGRYTAIGGAMICTATVWVGLRESRNRSR
jgi:drug/metabolite transporter (DMT)-like permease